LTACLAEAWLGDGWRRIWCEGQVCV
jgi:hypothetical protein